MRAIPVPPASGYRLKNSIQKGLIETIIVSFLLNGSSLLYQLILRAINY